jgi:signal transduction histidine kinase
VRTFLLLRFTLIVATGYLLLGQGRELGLRGGVITLLAAALASNLLLAWRRPRQLASPRWTGAVLVADTLWVTAALVVSGRFEGEFFYLYFFVLFLAALAESLHLIALGAVLVSCSYLYAVVAEAGFGPLTSPAYLVRIPFLIAVAAFYGYFVERVRHQQRRSREEAVAAARTEQLLRRTNRQLRELGDLKNRFVSLVSHELRTPLTATGNAIGLVGRAGETSAEQRRFLDMAQRNLDRLGRILDDMLDLSKLEARGLELSFSAMAPAALAAAAAAAFEAQASEATLELAVCAEPGLPAAWADPARSGQVLANLLSNALKFTSAGGRVTVHAALEADQVALSVADTGPGISRTEQEKIFDRFYQVGEVLTRSVRGTGLGLAIAREMAACQGGTLTVESEPGSGSRFTFRLPVHTPGAEEMARLDDLLAPLRVHPFNALLVVEPELLDGWGSTLESLARRLREALPRSGDQLVSQPAAGRVVVLLSGTAPAGAVVVARRLHDHLATDGGGGARVRGPAVYPTDGTTAWQLVEHALSGADDAAPPAGETP